MTWRDFYARTTNPYGASGPFYGSTGHHGADFAAAPHGTIPSYFYGTCVKNAHSAALGNYSVYKVGSVYIGYAHLLVGTRQNVGAKVNPGDSIGKAAGTGDDHGSSWRGAHCHTTRSNYISGITDGRTLDPVPAIKRAIANTTGSTSPLAGSKYTTARANEGFIAIAKRVGVSLNTLERLNPRVDGGNLRLGQRVYYA